LGCRSLEEFCLVGSVWDFNGLVPEPTLNFFAKRSARADLFYIPNRTLHCSILCYHIHCVNDYMASNRGDKMRHLIPTTCLLLITISLVFTPSAQAMEYIPGQVLVFLESDVSGIKLKNNPTTLGDDALGRVLENASITSVEFISDQGLKSTGPSSRYLILKSDSPHFDAVSVARNLALTPSIKSASPNYIRQLFVQPNDPMTTTQWHVQPDNPAAISLPEAWDLEQGSPATIIAILDTGVDTGHPDLAGNIWTNSGEIAGNGVDDDGNGYIDDINGWDFGGDLETVPITGAAQLEATRGMVSLLDGPGVLAGSVKVMTPRAWQNPVRTRINIATGEQGFGRVGLQHITTAGDWQFVGAGNWQGRNAWPLPGEGDLRENSDLSQFSMLMHGGREIAGTGHISFLATGWTGEKGVPAELHLGNEARFWRYPVRQRLLLGSSLNLPLNDLGTWDFDANLSIDFFKQEIDPRGPDGWDSPKIAGLDFETNHDQTGFGRAKITHWFNDTAHLALQGTARYARHRESLVFDGPELEYSQVLTSLVAEGQYHPLEKMTLRAGLGLDAATTPKTGDKPTRSGDAAPALSFRLVQRVKGQTEVHAGASLRSRFPSLRELYSGALGKFVPNPNLVPEQQELYEVGLKTSGKRWHLEGSAFLSYLHDGIEKEKLEGTSGQFMRVNRTEIRVPGLEMIGVLDLLPGVSLSLQHTILAARVLESGSFDAVAEDRPDYISHAQVKWQDSTGPGVLAEAVVTGPRWSADASNVVDGLRRLPAAVTWNMRFGWRFVVMGDSDWEAYVRVANVFDTWVDGQVGLPEPGRVLSGGVSLGF